MARVPISGPDARLAIIDRFVGRAAGDAIILDTGEAALARRGQMRLQVVQIEVEADVAVEVAVARVARVTGVPAPDLAGGIRVAAKGGDAVGREDRGKRRVAWPWPGVQNAVCIGDEPAKVGLLQHILQALHIGALRQPDAPRLATKTAPVIDRKSVV